MTADGNRRVSRRAVLRSAALAGTLAATGSVATQVGSAKIRPVFPEYVRDARGGTYADLRGEQSVTVEVGAGETKFAFDPALVWVDPGTTVTFEWVSDNHNVVHWSRPEGTDWRGTGATLYDTGHTHSHTFEVPGMYTYYCQPHDQIGMKGAVAVGSDVPTTERDFADDADTVFGVRLPSNPLQWGVAAVATVGATALGTAGAWLWWTSSRVGVAEYPDPDSDSDLDVGPVAGDSDGRVDAVDEALATGDEQAETARQAAAEDEFRQAVAAWEDALASYERALRVVDGGGREREIRDRIETAEDGLSTARERRDGAADLDRRLETAVEHRERAERAFADGDYDAALAALDSATTELDRAADLDAEHDLDADKRVAGEREVVATLRERCEGR